MTEVTDQSAEPASSRSADAGGGSQQSRPAANQVLVIEDEPNIIEAISFILSRDGWTVHTHSNGETAVEAVRRFMPDALILDVMLPGRSGYDILQDLRSDPQTREIPVMMLTARGQKNDRDLAHRLGVDRFMTKPFSNAEVVENLREIVRGGAPDTQGG